VPLDPKVRAALERRRLIMGALAAIGTGAAIAVAVFALLSWLFQ
jgi:type IV secretory pathway TrbD component